MSDLVLSHPFVRAAAEALGCAHLIEHATRCEAEGKLFEAAKRLGSAAGTEEELSKGGIGSLAGRDGDAAIVAYSAEGDVPPSEATLLLRAVELLVNAEPQTNEMRVLEMTMRGRAVV